MLYALILKQSPYNALTSTLEFGIYAGNYLYFTFHYRVLKGLVFIFPFLFLVLLTICGIKVSIIHKRETAQKYLTV